MEKRERGANFTKEEEKILIDLVLVKYRSILENRKSDAATWKAKEAAWENLTNDFNTLSGVVSRSTKTLKIKYEGLKRAMKKNSAVLRKDICRTGGSSNSDVHMDSTDETMVSIRAKKEVNGPRGPVRDNEHPEVTIEEIEVRPIINFHHDDCRDFSPIIMGQTASKSWSTSVEASESEDINEIGQSNPGDRHKQPVGLGLRYEGGKTDRRSQKRKYSSMDMSIMAYEDLAEEKMLFVKAKSELVATEKKLIERKFEAEIELLKMKLTDFKEECKFNAEVRLLTLEKQKLELALLEESRSKKQC